MGGERSVGHAFHIHIYIYAHSTLLFAHMQIREWSGHTYSKREREREANIHTYHIVHSHCRCAFFVGHF